jgi:metal-dependent amidase/aminoacylase/carboxypeptidase family protein
LLFQPAEENGDGAKLVVKDLEEVGIQPDMCFALHNLPGYPLHQVVYHYGLFTPAVTSILVKLNGKTSHAAEPEFGINPAMAIAEIIHAYDNLNELDRKNEKFCIVTPIYAHMGDFSYGISAGTGEVHYTIRTWTNDVLEEKCRQAVELAEKIARKHKLQLSIDWTEEFAANENDNAAVDIIKQSADQLGLSSLELDTPMRWGEDFGLFTQKYSGAMFGIGSGEDCPALHNPDYDFPEEIMTTAIDMFYRILENAMRSC